MVKGNGFYHINEYSLLLPSKRSEKPIESNVISGRGPYSVAFTAKKGKETLKKQRNSSQLSFCVAF